MVPTAVPGVSSASGAVSVGLSTVVGSLAVGLPVPGSGRVPIGTVPVLPVGAIV